MSKRPDIIENARAELPATETPAPDWLRDRLDWFMDLRFGLMLHWGPYCQWDCIESWPLVPADTWARPDDLACWNERGRDLERFSRDYRMLNRTFNPTRFDPEAWAELACDAGMRYVTFTTKHHDGFCMFDTATTDYRVTHPDCPSTTPAGQHRQGGLRGLPAARAGGELLLLQIGLELSPLLGTRLSRGRPPCNYDPGEHPGRWERFIRFVYRQVEELMTGYGKIDVLWLDGGQVRPPRQDIRMGELAAMARSHQPGLLIADRASQGPFEDFLTPEQRIPEEPPAEPWESCMTLGNSWKYVSNDTFKSAEQVIRVLVETTAKGGNLLLGLGPDADGRLPEAACRRLREVGRWLTANGEAIYGCRPADPYQAEGVHYTEKPPYTYGLVINKQEDPPPVCQAFGGMVPRAGTDVRILGQPEALPWHRHEHGFQVDLPRGSPASGPGLGVEVPTRGPGVKPSPVFAAEGPLRVRESMAELQPFTVKPFAFYSVSFEVRASASGYWLADFFDAGGERNYADHYSSFDPGPSWTGYESVFMARHDAVQARLGFRVINDAFSVRRVVVRPVDRPDVLRWMDGLYRTMPPVPGDVEVHHPGALSRTHDVLRRSQTLRLVMFGDSVANDMANSHFHLLVEQANPGSRIDLVHSSHPEKGMSRYQHGNLVQPYVIDLRPDLLVLAGMSHRDVGAICSVIDQVRRRIDPDVMFMNLAVCSHNTGFPADDGFIPELVEAATRRRFAVVDLCPPWKEYIAASDRPAEWHRRDENHVNDRGRQVIARLLLACFKQVAAAFP